MRRENEPDEQLTKDSMAAVIQATMPFNVNKHEFTVHTNTHPYRMYEYEDHGS